MTEYTYMAMETLAEEHFFDELSFWIKHVESAGSCSESNEDRQRKMLQSQLLESSSDYIDRYDKHAIAGMILTAQAYSGNGHLQPGTLDEIMSDAKVKLLRLQEEFSTLDVPFAIRKGHQIYEGLTCGKGIELKLKRQGDANETLTPLLFLTDNDPAVAYVSGYSGRHECEYPIANRSAHSFEVQGSDGLVMPVRQELSSRTQYTFSFGEQAVKQTFKEAGMGDIRSNRFRSARVVRSFYL